MTEKAKEILEAASNEYAEIWDDFFARPSLVPTDFLEERGDVALVSADELQGLIETAHLMRSPRNAERLFSALDRALKGTEEPTGIQLLKT